MNGFFLTHAAIRAMFQCTSWCGRTVVLCLTLSFVLWSSRTIRSVSSPTTVTHLKYSAAAKRAVSMIKQSALSLALTYSIPGILANGQFQCCIINKALLIVTVGAKLRFGEVKYSIIDYPIGTSLCGMCRCV